MQLHAIISVTATSEPDVYLASVDITDTAGERYTADYVSRDGDTFGLAPTIRGAIVQWITDGKPVQPYVEPVPTPEELVAYAAQKRWEKEVGGTEVSGLVVHTDDRSKALIMGARIAAEADPDFTTDWKTADGSFVTIDAATIISVSNAVLAHVAACFAIEAQVLAGVEAETITTTAEIDAAFA